MPHSIGKTGPGFGQSIKDGRNGVSRIAGGARGLKICVEIGELDEKVVKRIAAAAMGHWAPMVEVISPRQEVPESAEGLLVVGTGRRSRPAGNLLWIERIDTAGKDLQQILFQVDANLGRMTASDLLKSKVPVSMRADRGRVSRREFFLGMRAVYTVRSDAPFVFHSACEAKYGCTKCIDGCPSDALSLEHGMVEVDPTKCTRCGECATVCPVSAIQMPKLSEDALDGLLSGLARSAAPAAILVLTCDRSKTEPRQWTFVEQVDDVGIIGPRQILAAASSGLAALIVYCADGSCQGLSKAKRAVESVRRAMADRTGFVVEFLVGDEGRDEIRRFAVGEQFRKRVVRGAGKEPWLRFTGALSSLADPGAQALDLGLTNLKISDTCTLCGTCEKSCPHSALAVKGGVLEFDSARCTSCGYCAQVCPEKSITIEPLENISGLDRRAVFQDEIVNCARCGTPLGSRGLLRRVTVLVGREDPMMKYCQNCKQIIALSSLSSSDGSGKGKGPPSAPSQAPGSPPKA